ncbi:PolC-type DNA polymerase III [Chryseobacterium koreense]|mgnify:CR=1 FL=1|uniref:3'-5' exonuclease n=1 Tax=Chryseobacterium koreense TaxID=232216 RepID=UPI0026F33A4B|nr:3'-5' exonuclease [Chryseobacterium koreense]
MYSIIDIESNGAGFRKENIIEVAIYKYDGHEIVDQFISLVNPQSEITPFVQKLTKITPKMVKTAPKFHEIAKRVIEITDGTTLVGHNIDFDYRMLRQEFKRLGYEFTINTLDTIPLAKKLIPEAESYSLGKLVKSLGIPLSEQHRAGGDARATLDLLKLLIIKDADSEIIQQQFEDKNSDSYFNKVRNLTQDLPSERGILYFQNLDGKIIFFDFVDDLSKSAKKIFASKLKRWETIQTETEKIHYELTGNKILGKLMMKTKGLQKRESLPFGLYHQNGKYFADKISQQKDEKPILRFSSFTQGLKAVTHLKSNENFNDVQQLLKFIDLKKRNELWLSSGRTLGEKSFLVLENGNVTSYGFYEFHTQIKSRKQINQLKIEIKTTSHDLQNDLKLGLLRGDFEVLPLPK